MSVSVRVRGGAKERDEDSRSDFMFVVDYWVGVFFFFGKKESSKQI